MSSLFEMDRPPPKVFFNNDTPSNMQQYYSGDKTVAAKQMNEHFVIITYANISYESGKSGDYVVQEKNNLTVKKRNKFETQFAQ